MPDQKISDYKETSVKYYFSMLKSRLQKLDGLTHEELKENITKTIKTFKKKIQKHN